MKFKTIIEEDSVTPYLDDINTRLHASKQEIIYEIGRTFADEGASRIEDWQGNLAASVDNPDNWHLFNEEDIMKLDIVFSGTIQEDSGERYWYEFADPNSSTGGRNYAYYQETGIDPIASFKDARNRGYVRKSTEPTQRFAENYLQKEIRRIIMTK